MEIDSFGVKDFM